MKCRYTLPAVLIAASIQGASAAAPAAVDAPVHTIAWLNDFSYLADASQRDTLWEKMRYIPLGDSPQRYLSLGGELRYQYLDMDHAQLGVRPADGNSMLQQRIRLSADLHLSRSFRAFVELGDDREYGAESVTPPNRGELDVQQAFFDATFKLGKGALTLRPGRFVMPLGSGRIVALREGVNKRYSYQGLRATYRTDSVRVDAFSVRPMELRPGRFDDRGDTSRSFSGVYASFSPKGAQGINFDVYGYSVSREVARYSNVAGPERRNSLGVRMWRKGSPWDYDVEGIYQFGNTNGLSARAWGAMFDAGYTFGQASLKPRLGLKANAFSGDRDRNDGRLETFSPPSPGAFVYTDSGFFTMMNLSDISPVVSIQATPTVRVSANLDVLYRTSTKDGIYFLPSSAPYGPVNGSARHVATNANAVVDWRANRFLNLHFYYTHVDAGEALLQAGGKDSHYVGLWAQLLF
ncbi:alginate export family protein [Pseudoxanthomonas sp. JBR18]|uniref:alginate export family protein n=1 Tax=Pseudoxanthomonas sp. JBR18 TaxID=2969308 RepID=UPI00230607AC|nr:alginate export family protein [Pseudoxanthomonas sp. JBR18]WCE06238.1 alginate export family protein [Pseudoxanthomonas sp. JBR18]